MVGSPPAKAGDIGSIPGPEGHMLWGNLARIATAEPMCRKACALEQEKPPQWEVQVAQLRIDSTFCN